MRVRGDGWGFAAFALAGALLLLPNLGGRALWSDEAETALVARGVLESGLPLAWDGRQLVTQAGGRELTDGFLWAWTPWAMHYVAAAGLVLHDSAWGARLPFALLGCLSLGATFWVARKLLRDPLAAYAAGVLLLASVQYLLLLRQCRYYALAALAALVATWAYADLPRRRGGFLLAASLAVLFQANYASAALVALGLGLHALAVRREAELVPGLLGALAFAGAGALAWGLATGLPGRLTGVAGADGYALGFVDAVLVVNRFVCPALLLAVLAVAGWKSRLRVGGAYALVVCMVAPALLLLPAFLWSNPRYVVHLIPLGAIATAAAWREVDLRSRAAGVLAALLLGATHLLPALLVAPLPTRVGAERWSGLFATGPGVLPRALFRSEWLDYAHELRHPFEGPDEAIARALAERAHPDDIVLAPVDPLPLMFHTRLRAAALLDPSARARPGWDALPDFLFDPGAASWIVLRRRQMSPALYRALLEAAEQRGAQPGYRASAYRLGARDVAQPGRPYQSDRDEYPYRHYFRTPAPGASDEVVLLHLERVAPP